LGRRIGIAPLLHRPDRVAHVRPGIRLRYRSGSCKLQGNNERHQGSHWLTFLKVSRFTTPSPSRIVTNWFAATAFTGSRPPLGPQIPRPPGGADPAPKGRGGSFTEK